MDTVELRGMHHNNHNHSGHVASSTPVPGNHSHMTMMDHGNHTGMGGNMDHTGHAMHNMYFNVKYPVQILFVEWLVMTPGQLAGACIGVFILSILYEGLKVLRMWLLIRASPKRRYMENGNDTLKNGIDGSNGVMYSSGSGSVASRMCNGWHILQSVLQVVQTTLGMFLMLIYMTFNVWLALCVSLGSGFGYYFFGWMQRQNIEWSDHCN